MKFLLNVAQVYVLFFGASGFLFGQLYFGLFAWGATLAGVSGVVGALLGQRSSAAPRYLAVAACAIAVAGVAMDAFNYYTRLDIPGNYYAWFLIGPYAVALLFIGYLNAKPASASSPVQR